MWSATRMIPSLVAWVSSTEHVSSRVSCSCRRVSVAAGGPFTPQSAGHWTTTDQLEALAQAAGADPTIGYLMRAAALCSLPRTNPGTADRYVRRNGPFAPRHDRRRRAAETALREPATTHPRMDGDRSHPHPTPMVEARSHVQRLHAGTRHREHQWVARLSDVRPERLDSSAVGALPVALCDHGDVVPLRHVPTVARRPNDCSPATNLPSPAPGERVSGREKQARNPGRCEPAGPNSSRPNPTSAGGSTARYSRPRPLRARRPKLKPSQPYVGGGIDCQILTSAPAAWSEPARPSARRCSAQAAHRLVSVSSLASGSTERAHRRHFQVITATTLRRIQRPRPDRSEVSRIE